MTYGPGLPFISLKTKNERALSDDRLAKHSLRVTALDISHQDAFRLIAEYWRISSNDNLVSKKNQTFFAGIRLQCPLVASTLLIKRVSTMMFFGATESRFSAVYPTRHGPSEPAGLTPTRK